MKATLIHLEGDEAERFVIEHQLQTAMEEARAKALEVHEKAIEKKKYVHMLTRLMPPGQVALLIQELECETRAHKYRVYAFEFGQTLEMRDLCISLLELWAQRLSQRMGLGPSGTMAVDTGPPVTKR